MKLRENIEDQQSEIHDKFNELIAIVGDPNQQKQLQTEFNRLNAQFMQGYETDNDNLMYGSLDDMKELVRGMQGMAVESYQPMNLLRELMQLDEGAKKKKKGLRKAAKAVYHRDYVKTKDKPYRKYDPEEYQHKD